MRCPYCKEDLEISYAVIDNISTYKRPAIARAMCCGKLVRLIPLETYEVQVYEGDKTTDDWGK